jgi:hypothetical protein
MSDTKAATAVVAALREATAVIDSSTPPYPGDALAPFQALIEDLHDHLLEVARVLEAPLLPKTGRPWQGRAK